MIMVSRHLRLSLKNESQTILFPWITGFLLYTTLITGIGALFHIEILHWPPQWRVAFPGPEETQKFSQEAQHVPWILTVESPIFKTSPLWNQDDLSHDQDHLMIWKTITLSHPVYEKSFLNLIKTISPHAKFLIDTPDQRIKEFTKLFAIGTAFLICLISILKIISTRIQLECHRPVLEIFLLIGTKPSILTRFFLIQASKNTLKTLLMTGFLSSLTISLSELPFFILQQVPDYATPKFLFFVISIISMITFILNITLTWGTVAWTIRRISSS